MMKSASWNLKKWIPRKHLEPEIAKISSDEDLSIQGALNRLTERMKNTVPQDHDV